MMRITNAFLIVLMSTLVVLLLMSVPVLADDNPFQYKSPFKSAIIKYKYSGSETGESEVYFLGDKKAEYKQTSTKVMGVSAGKSNTIIITSPDKVIIVDLDKARARSTGNPMTYMAEEYNKLSAAEKKQVRQNSEEAGTSMMNSFMGGKPETRSGTFLGKPVKIVTMGGFTTYTWEDKGVVLKSSGSMMGIKTDMEATGVQVGVSVPSSKFKVPNGIEVVFDQEADQQQRQMVRHMITSLKDPEFGSKMESGAGSFAPPQKDKSSGSDDEDQEQQPPDSMEERMKTFKKFLRKNKDLFEKEE